MLLLLALAGTVPLRRAIDQRSSRAAEAGGLWDAPSGETLRRMALGYSGLLADIYWTRVVQYYGRERLSGSNRYDRLRPLLQVVTTLDPHLLIAYRFGAIFLAEKPPTGAGQPQAALDLLRRGIVANPGYWRLWQDLGFVYYWNLRDYPSAARAFELGSEQQGAELWMKAMAAAIAAEGGETRTSRLLWSEIYRQAENESIRRSALAHLTALTAEAQMGELDALLARYHAEKGRDATSFRELVQVGLLGSEPLDPSQVHYVIGPDGRVALGPASAVDLQLLR